MQVSQHSAVRTSPGLYLNSYACHCTPSSLASTISSSRSVVITANRPYVFCTTHRVNKRIRTINRDTDHDAPSSQLAEQRLRPRHNASQQAPLRYHDSTAGQLHKRHDRHQQVAAKHGQHQPQRQRRVMCCCESLWQQGAQRAWDEEDDRLQPLRVMRIAQCGQTQYGRQQTEIA